jgi:hypothetical protein
LLVHHMNRKLHCHVSVPRKTRIRNFVHRTWPLTSLLIQFSLIFIIPPLTLRSSMLFFSHTWPRSVTFSEVTFLRILHSYLSPYYTPCFYRFRFKL